MEGLEPCPFCGGTNIFVGTIAEIEAQCEDHEDYLDNSGLYSVVCDYTKGGCGASSGHYRDKEEAIAKWNRRACGEK